MPETAAWTGPALAPYQDFAQRLTAGLSVAEDLAFPACESDIVYTGHDPLQTDLDHLGRAVRDHGAGRGFLTAASPGMIALALPDRHYGDRDTYLAALGSAMRQEYLSIHRAGFVLRLTARTWR